MVLYSSSISIRLSLLDHHILTPSQTDNMPPNTRLSTRQQHSSTKKGKKGLQQRAREWLLNKLGLAPASHATIRARRGKAQHMTKKRQAGALTGTQIDDSVSSNDSDTDTDSPPVRRYQVRVRDVNGAEYVYRIKGDALEASSPYFRAVTSQRWTKAGVPTVLEEDPELFESYAGLVCYGQDTWQQDIDASIAQSRLHPTDGDRVPADIVRKREKVFEDLIELYIFADKFMDPATANIVIDQMVRYSAETCLLPHVGAVDRAYESTPDGSPLRMLLRDWFIHEAFADTVEELVQSEVHPDFLADMVIGSCRLKFENIQGTVRKRYFQPAADRPAGHYHQHVPGLIAGAAEDMPDGSIELLRIDPPREMLGNVTEDGEESDGDSSDDEA